MFCATVLIGLGSEACDCGGGGLQQGKPLVSVEPTEIAFGALNVGEQNPQVLTIRNSGTAALEIGSITLVGPPDFTLESLDGVLFDDLEFPVGVAQPGSSVPPRVELVVVFAPQARAEFEGRIEILSNADNQELLEVPVSGVGSVSDIEVTPQLLDFGPIGVGSTGSLSLTIGNTGEADLIVHADDLQLESGETEAPFFWLLEQDLVLVQDQQRAVEVIYRPQEPVVDPVTLQVIPDVDALLVGSNDPDENPVRVELRGTAAGNLPPFAAIRVTRVDQLDGSPLPDPCVPAPSDTIHFEAVVADPEGGGIQDSNLRWLLEGKPTGSTRSIQTDPDAFHPTFKADLSGEYLVCLEASDPQGNRSKYDTAEACTCEQANTDTVYSCPCVRLQAYPREDIRVELTWDILGPDLDLHLVAPGGQFCSPTRDCRVNPIKPDDPNWTKTACVVGGTITACWTPNCDPIPAGCLDGQECYDDGVAGSQCWWRTCSGTDCYWNARNPDWGVSGDPSDDPMLAIDCTGGCRAENINLNKPVPGIYTIQVGYYGTFRGSTEARVRVYFKGDAVPSAEFTSQMTAACDRWNVATIDWIDHENHPVTYLGDAHSSTCCN